MAVFNPGAAAQYLAFFIELAALNGEANSDGILVTISIVYNGRSWLYTSVKAVMVIYHTSCLSICRSNRIAT